MAIKIYKFTAGWCKPCQLVEPILAKLEASIEGLTFVKVDVDDPEALQTACAELGMPSGPSGVPMFAHKESASRFQGSISESTLRNWITGLQGA